MATHTEAAAFVDEWERRSAQGMTDEQIRDEMLGEQARRRRAVQSTAPRPTPGVTVPIPKQPHQASGRAIQDVMELACDIRDVDPAQWWATVEQWTPTRIMMALLAASAAIDPDKTERQLWGWTTTLIEESAA
ncbi:DUF7368 family protein [Gordonia sp. DT219]|uniref:DUF7368 family protein n=1 Tax=Gordonia sp. DT219 TaxID=3416658 RepID=UPI003CF25586